MKKIITGILITAYSLLSVASAQLPSNFEFTHPGVTFNNQDLDRMVSNRNIEPWATGYQIMLDDRRSSFNYDMQGPARVVARNGENDRAYNDDANAAFFNAIQYYITRDDRYAENAMSIIDAWASTNIRIEGNVPSITIADQGVRLITAAEILRYNYSGWTRRLTNVTEAYVRNVLLPPLYIPEYTRVANQGAGQINGAMALAVYINDETYFEQVIDTFLNEDCSGISNTLASGETGDTGRDYGHAFGHVLNLAAAAENANKQGIDLFSTLDNRLLAISEYWNAYGLGVEVDYTPYGTCYDFFPTIGDRGRGFNDFNTNILLEIIDGAYNVRMGIPNPFTTQRINEIPTSINTFFYKKGVDTTRSDRIVEPYADHTGRTNNRLTGGSIGNNRNGLADFNSNRWTITSSNGDVFGESDNDNFEFAYRRVDGNATLITRIDSVRSANSNVKVGVMFRETLDSDSRMLALWSRNAGDGIQTTWRGQDTVYNERESDGSNLRSFLEDVTLPAWVRVEFNNNRATVSYSEDRNIWVPFTSGVFSNVDDYYLGIYTASSNNDTATGVFSSTVILTDEGQAPAPAPTPRAPTTPTGGSFVPNPNSTYYIDSPRHNLRLGSNGSSEEPFTTAINTTGDNVEWKFVSNGNGGWHIDRADGGSLPRLRTDRTEFADMQSTDFDGRFETFSISNGSNNTSFLSIPRGPEGFTRLQIDPAGSVNMVPSTFAGSWEEFRITEASSSERVVSIRKRNAQGFALDGNNGAANGQSIFLFSQNRNNVNQQWIEINRGGGYYSYQKQATEHCIDGGRGGANRQDVYLWECLENNQNQHWEKVSTDSGFFQLVKRNAPGFAIDGGSGGVDFQNVQLFDSSERSQNLQWIID